MTQQELTKYNLGRDLDELMNLDPRGYGVCRILYPASREYAGANVSMHFAEKLLETVSEGDLVYIITGFRLLPHGSPETDGIIGSTLLCRTLVHMGVKPVLVVPEQCVEAARSMAAVCGLHFYTDVESVLEYPQAMAAVTFTTDIEKAAARADELLSGVAPKAVIAIEAPGANECGVYHNATGLDVSHFEAKTDALFDKAKEMGITTFAVGDLGNEMGMGTLREHLERYIPYAQKGAENSTCRCGCNGGILARTAADVVLTATVSDWGVYAVIAAIAFLREDESLMHTPEMEKEAVTAASRAGMVDMYGWLVPAIDGQDMSILTSIVSLMRSCMTSALSLRETCRTWFEKTIELGYFDGAK